MNLERAIRLARTWAFGGVCSLQEGETQEYHKLALAALESQRDGAVPVVRCGECKHWRPGDFMTGDDIDHMCRGGRCPTKRFTVYENDFCSDGEREEEDV